MGRNVVNRGLLVWTTVVGGLTVGLFRGQAMAAPRIHDLGTLGGSSSFARDINEAGQIVGESTLRNGNTHAFLSTPWITNGRLVDLGTLGGRSSFAFAVSNRGQVTGSSTLTAAGDQTRAFLWDQGRMTALPALAGATFSEGLDVNDGGTVVGQSGGLAVRWQNGTVQGLGDLGGGSSFATGINSSGVIVGNAPTATFEFHGWVWRNGVITELRPFGSTFSSADGINSSGDIVGIFESAAGVVHGYIFSHGAFTDLGPSESFSVARAVSDSGLIVGEISADSFVHGSLWDFNRRVVDLGALPGSTFSSAFSVNSGGTVVGVSSNGNDNRAVVWR